MSKTLRYVLPVVLVFVFLFAAKFNPSEAVTCTATVNGSCTFNGTTSGLDSGSGTTNSSVLTVTSGTVTIAFNQVIALGKIALNGGSIAIVNGGKILLNTPLWMVDADGDTKPESLTVYAQATAPTNAKRYYTITDTANVDCDPYNTSVYYGNPNWYATAIVDVGGTSAKNGTFDYNCSGANEKEHATTLYACDQAGCDIYHYTVTTGWVAAPACGAAGTMQTASTPGACVSAACNYTTASITERCH